MTFAAILGLKTETKVFPEIVSIEVKGSDLNREELKGVRPAFASSPAAAIIVKKDRLYIVSIDLS